MRDTANKEQTGPPFLKARSLLSVSDSTNRLPAVNGEETRSLTSIFDQSKKFDHVRRLDERLRIFRFGRIVVRQREKTLELIDPFASIFALIEQRISSKDESIVDLFLFGQRDRTNRSDFHRHSDRQGKVKRSVVVVDRVQLDDAVGIVFEKDSPKLFDRVDQRILSDDQRREIDGKSLNERRVDVRRAEQLTEIETIVIIYRGDQTREEKTGENEDLHGTM